MLDTQSRFQQDATSEPLLPLQIHPLPIEEIRPVVRIAHRRLGPVNIPPRIIFDYEIVLIFSGRGTLTIEDTAHPFGAHDLLCIPPFTPHSFSSDPESKMEHAAIHFDFAPGMPRSGEPDQRAPYLVRLSQGHLLPVRMTLVEGHRIERHVLNLLRERGSRDSLATLAVVRHATALLIDVLRESATLAFPPNAAQAQHRVRIARSVAHIVGHLQEEVNPRDLARIAGLSVSRFNVIFRQGTGWSPLEFVRRTRIDAARTLLADDTLSIKQVAAQVGFSDPYHFSKAFRRIDGLSPSHYRAALLAGEFGKR